MRILQVSGEKVKRKKEEVQARRSSSPFAAAESICPPPLPCLRSKAPSIPYNAVSPTGSLQGARLRALSLARRDSTRLQTADPRPPPRQSSGAGEADGGGAECGRLGGRWSRVISSYSRRDQRGVGGARR